jgi:tetratricopeptide (TPR) repeat protein
MWEGAQFMKKLRLVVISLLMIGQTSLAAQQNEDQIYVDVIKSFRLRNQLALKKNVEILLQKYPKSSFADNAIYLRGQQMMQNRQFTEAIREFQKINDLYPRSNKAVSALFSKGQAYRKLNLFDVAEKTFKQIKKQYPGSPEAERSELELKLVEVQKAG